MKTRNLLIGLGILLVGVAGVAILTALRPEPERTERSAVVPAVTAVQPEARTGPLWVFGTGTVQPTREVNVSAEVPGRIVWVNPSFHSGGRFDRGQTLVRIDDTDYLNAVAVAEAEVTARRLELLLAEEETEIARDEWRRLESRLGRAGEPEHVDTTGLGSLVLKEPQLKLAQSLLASAEARLADAQTRLARTAVRAPFTGQIRTTLAQVGQYAGPGTPVAAMYATDEVEIPVGLQSSQAALVDGLFEQQPIPARVTARFGGREFAWDGYVHRSDGALDRATRTISAVVRVPSPYRTTEERPPLLVGSFASVAIQGADPGRYYIVPRGALRDGPSLWVAHDGVLSIRSADVLQEVDGRVFVRGPFEAGERVVTSDLQIVTEGMQVRVQP